MKFNNIREINFRGFCKFWANSPKIYYVKQGNLKICPLNFFGTSILWKFLIFKTNIFNLFSFFYSFTFVSSFSFLQITDIFMFSLIEFKNLNGFYLN